MNKLEQKIMASVAAIYLVRRLTSRRALKAYALLLSFLGIVAFVSLPHVAVNLFHVENHGFSALATYFLSAVTKTTVVVQLSLLISMIAAFSLGYDVLRAKGEIYYS